jgi:hypothetical protein
MTKSQLISVIKSCNTIQAQLWYDHITTYVQAHKHYPRLRFVGDKIAWFSTINTDLGVTIKKMRDLGYITLSGYRMVGRILSQYHELITPAVVRIPHKATADTIINSSSIVLHNIPNGIDIIQ